MLRMSPFSPGTVRISPCASKTARTPVGEIAELLICFATFSKCGRTSTRSAAMWTFTGVFAMARKVVKMQRAELLVDDRARSRIGRFDRQGRYSR